MDVFNLLQIFKSYYHQCFNNIYALCLHLLAHQWTFNCCRFLPSNASSVMNFDLILFDYFHIKCGIFCCSWPWNQATFMGYVGEIVAIITGCALYLLVGGIVLLLFISICLHHQAFHKLFEHLVYHKSKKCDKVFLCDLIRFHITVKE